MLRQRKVPKRKAIPEACPLRGFPALLVKPGARATRYAQTGASVLRPLLRCSAAPDGGSQNQHQKPDISFPFALTEYRSQSGNRRAPCLRQVYLPSCARPRRGEERRESAQPMSAPECPSLWVLSLGQARESISPERAKQGVEKEPRSSGRNLYPNESARDPLSRKEREFSQRIDCDG